jgi:hypothetical protein
LTRREQPWKPSLDPDVDLRELPLTPEEAFVASRLDGATDAKGLANGTGLPPERIEAALEKLASLGAVERPEPSEEEEQDEPDEGAEGIHRKLYETTLHQLLPAERAARAKSAPDPELSAFCFDPLPEVINALLENTRFGPVQARLIAAHHPTPAGLDAIASRAAFAADPGVRRALLRNAQLPAAVLRRLYAGRRLLEQYKLVVSHDVPEQTRRTAREILRTRFAGADSDERVEVIVKTEGRCLGALSGLPIDGKTTAQLCARPYGSTLFVQNLSRWSACPPALVAHLLKQEIVRRTPALRLALQRHPNAPHESRG